MTENGPAREGIMHTYRTPLTKHTHIQQCTQNTAPWGDHHRGDLNHAYTFCILSKPFVIFILFSTSG